MPPLQALRLDISLIHAHPAGELLATTYHSYNATLLPTSPHVPCMFLGTSQPLHLLCGITPRLLHTPVFLQDTLGSEPFRALSSLFSYLMAPVSAWFKVNISKYSPNE